MIVFINGKKENVADNLTVSQLIDYLKLNRELIAVEINCNIVRKTEYNKYQLKENDEVEILTLIGGG